MTRVVSTGMQRLRALADTLSRMDSVRLDRPRLWIGESEAGIFVDFFGDPGEDEPPVFPELLDILSSPDIASRLTGLVLRGPDHGANGTANWDLNKLVPEGVSYPRLLNVSIELGRPEDHNAHIVAEGYDEDGVLARLLQAAPALQSLETPSAPDARFFQTPPRALKVLVARAGYDHQGFLDNLAASTNLPNLYVLDYGEPAGETSDYFEHSPYESYVRLCQSKSVKLRFLRLYNPALTDEQCTALRAICGNIQFHVVRAAAAYVRQ